MAIVAPPSVRVARAAQFFARPENYLDGNYRVPLRAEIVRRLLGSIDGAQVVDLGCGDASISAPLLADHRHLTLVDASPKMLERARARAPAATCICTGLEAFDGAGRFDIALCIGILSHVDHTLPALAAVARSLRPGGKAVVQLSDDDRLATKLFHLVGHGRLAYRRTSLSEVLMAAGSVGLSPVATERHLLLLPGLGRILGRHLRAWDRFVVRRRWLSRHAMDAIIVFRKA